MKRLCLIFASLKSVKALHRHSIEKVRSSSINALKREKHKPEVVDSSAARFFLEVKTSKRKENTSNTENVILTAYYRYADKRTVAVLPAGSVFNRSRRHGAPCVRNNEKIHKRFNGQKIPRKTKGNGLRKTVPKTFLK